MILNFEKNDSPGYQTPGESPVKILSIDSPGSATQGGRLPTLSDPREISNNCNKSAKSYPKVENILARWSVPQVGLIDGEKKIEIDNLV